MSARILVGLEGNASVEDVIGELRDLGAKQVGPIENIPDVLLAYVDEDPDGFIRRALMLPGVRHAEQDQLKSTY